jgi:HEAT repeat protein
MSTDPARRREAIAHLSERKLSSAEVEAIGRVILADPDPDVRVAAVRALARAPDDPPLGLVERALQDPDDAVRAAMVEVAAARCRPASPVIVRLAVRRRWPLAQMAALRHLPEVLEAVPARAEENLETLLSGVASMEPPPLESERPALAEVARAIGSDRLMSELVQPGPRRLGSVRLLLMEGSVRSLRRVAELTDDPVEEVRMSAAAAVNILGTTPLAGESTRDEATNAEEEPTDDEIVAALAGALADPSEAVRARAREGLDRGRRATVLEWVERTLKEPDPRVAARAAAVAEALHLQPAAGALLDRASSAAPEFRGPYVGALDALRIHPAELGHLAAGVDPARRHQAVRLVWLVGGRYVLPFVRTLVEDPSASVRAAALEVLNEASDPAAPSLADRLMQRDASPVVRAAAVRILGRAGGERRVGALGRALEDPDPAVRAMAVDALPVELSAELSVVLLRALRDEDERVWRAALPHLARIPEADLPSLWGAFRESDSRKREEIGVAMTRGGGDVFTALAAANAAAPDWADRALAIEVATRAGTEAGLAVVLDGLEDPDPIVRRAAATALGMLRTVHAVPALGRSLSDPKPDVRVEAVRALGGIDDHSVVPLLISALKDPAPRVRSMAGESLLRWRSPDVARQLAAALSSPDLRQAAGQILAGMGEAAVEPLVDVAVEAGGDTAVAAGRMLERMVGPEPFIAQLSSRNRNDRIRAVEVLGAIGRPKASEWLLGSLADPDEGVRSRVVVLLGELGDPRALDYLKQVFLNDPVHAVTIAAEEALRRMGGMPADRPRALDLGDGGSEGDSEPEG